MGGKSRSGNYKLRVRLNNHKFALNTIDYFSHNTKLLFPDFDEKARFSESARKYDCRYVILKSSY